TRTVAARLRVRQVREPLADRREGARVRRGVRPRRAPDRRLVDVDDLVEEFQAFHALVRARRLARAIELARCGPVDRVDEKGGLAAAGDAGNAREHTQWNRGRDILEIVRARADDLE